MEDLEASFNAAADWVAGAVSSGQAPGFTDDVKLQFYGLYKQATTGPCNTAKPAFWNRAARLKWEAWNARGSTSQTQAMQDYVSLLSSLAPSWADSRQSGNVQGGEPEDADESGSQAKRGGGGFGPVFSTFAAAQDELDEDRQNQAPGPSLHALAGEGDVQGVLSLLESGVPVDERDGQGCTALHFAADRGQPEVAAVLLSHGAEVNATDEDGSSPLHYAALCGNERLAELLLDARADLRLEDSNGDTAQAIAPATWTCWEKYK